MFSIEAFSSGYVSVGLLAVAQYVFSYHDKSPEMKMIYEGIKEWTGLSDSAFDYGSGYALIGFFVVGFAGVIFHSLPK